jgi:hypothetical protein
MVFFLFFYIPEIKTISPVPGKANKHKESVANGFRKNLHFLKKKAMYNFIIILIGKKAINFIS